MQNSALSEEVVSDKAWDPEVGFEIPYGPNIMYMMLTCHAVVNGRHFHSKYIPQRRGESCFGGEVFRGIHSFGSSYLSHFHSFASEKCDDHPRPCQSAGWGHSHPELQRGDRI